MENEKKPHKGSENLRPVTTTEEAKARGKQGGIASGKAKREKKMMSQIYAEFLEKEHDIKLPSMEDKKKMSGNEIISLVVGEILSKGGGPAVSIIKELREGTEGNKLNINANIKEDHDFDIVD